MSVQSQIDRLNAVKERIRTNLIAQGVTVPDNTMLEEMAAQILSVSGEDGVPATHSWNGTTLTITSASGTSSADLKGAAGKTPVKGTDYFTAADKAEMVEDVLEAMDSVPTVVCQSTAPADTSVIWVDTDDNSVDEFQEAVNTALAQAKASGEFTPVKGTDYWTETDQESIVQQVITALGTPVFGTVDANKVITLTGALADGTYTVKYEDVEGNETTIGTLTAKAGPKYTNRIPLSINADGTPYNGGQGWKTGYRLNSSGTESEQAGIEVTGFIPATDSDTVYFNNISWNKESSTANHYYVSVYDVSFAKLASLNMQNLKSQAGAGVTYDASGNAVSLHMPTLAHYYQKQGIAYLRISAQEISNDSIITINEQIA